MHTSRCQGCLDRRNKSDDDDDETRRNHYEGMKVTTVLSTNSLKESQEIQRSLCGVDAGVSRSPTSPAKRQTGVTFILQPVRLLQSTHFLIGPNIKCEAVNGVTRQG